MAKKTRGYRAAAPTVRALGLRMPRKLNSSGFAAAKRANAKGARGGGGSPGMRKILGAGAQRKTKRPTQRPTRAPWMGDPWRGLRKTRSV